MAHINFITLYDRGCLGVRYISSILKKNKHTTSIVYLGRHEGKVKTAKDTLTSDDNLWVSVNEYGKELLRSYSEPLSPRDIEILLNLLARLKPDFIAFSLRSMFLDAATQITGQIRKAFDFPIIYGGIAATCEPEKCIRYADIICIGEGEQSMLELAERFDSKMPFDNTKNLWVRHNDDISKNSPHPLLQNLDELPFPDYAKENKYWISNAKIVEEDPSLGNLSEYTYEMITSRGCPFSCTYCCNDLLKKVYHGQRYLRRRSVGNVIEELKNAKTKFGIRTVLFKDEVFTFDLNWIREFSERYKHDIALPFWCYTYPSFADERILKLLKDCGMFNVTMGIQSGSERILYDVFNRRTPLKKIIDAASILDNLNLSIRPRYDIITNNPFETDQDRRDTLELLMRLKKPVNFGLTKLSFIPSTEISRMQKEKRKVDEKLYSFWNNLYLLNQYRFFPNRLIKLLSNNNFFRKNPHTLRLLLIGKFVEVKLQHLSEFVKAHLPKQLISFLRHARYALRRY